jgi:hypothetical protein
MEMEGQRLRLPGRRQLPAPGSWLKLINQQYAQPNYAAQHDIVSNQCITPGLDGNGYLQRIE